MAFLLVTALSCILGLGWAFPAGPPMYPEVCTGMTPKVFVQGFLIGHGVDPQSPSSNPFEVVTDSTCYNGQTKIQVWIQRKMGTSNIFKGFFLQARLADNYTTGYHPLDGTFEPVEGYDFTGAYSCPTAQNEDAENNVFAHDEEPVNAPVTSAVYTPGTEHNQKDITFVATVVEHQRQYWTFQTSRTISWKNSCEQLSIITGGSTTPKPFTLGVTVMTFIVYRVLQL